ncbi:hypothetical protein KDA_63700 [Dictyobacter alpinus]|uniref:Uncharacterized protein n=1 Tax=Dictyobacter alpinus TaxID=2014873 RepID=A0A402BHS3_9CHLR|nr:hypothetical protein [Dictyobacter alpinus]GCE30886.1 hypothetical protein KDA_63700 [Dictyobacter alpinus]
MVYSINTAAYTAKRAARPDEAQHTIMSRGNAQLATATLPGAFYHSVAVRSALLLALAQYLSEQVEQLILLIIQDPIFSSLTHSKASLFGAPPGY